MATTLTNVFVTGVLVGSVEPYVRISMSLNLLFLKCLVSFLLISFDVWLDTSLKSSFALASLGITVFEPGPV